MMNSLTLAKAFVVAFQRSMSANHRPMLVCSFFIHALNNF